MSEEVAGAPAATDDVARPVDPRQRRRATIRLGAFVVGLGAVAFVTVFFVPIDQDRLQSWIAPLGWFGPVAFVVVAALLALVFVPGPLLSAAAGVLFGTGLGFVVSLLSATLTAVIGLLIARRSGSTSLTELSGPRATAIANIGRRHGLVAVVLQRLVPGLSDAAFTYFFGLIRVRPWQIAVGTLIASAPRAFAYTALGESAVDRNPSLGAWAVGVLIAVGVLGAVLGIAAVRRERGEMRAELRRQRRSR